FPSFFGPTNIPPLEAMSLGCPVASSYVYAMRERLGDAALYFAPDSVEQMVDCIGRLWSDDDLCRRLVERGRARAARWNVHAFHRELQDVVRRLTSSTMYY